MERMEKVSNVPSSTNNTKPYAFVIIPPPATRNSGSDGPIRTIRGFSVYV